MRIDRIVMIEPRSPGHHVFSRYALPRLGLPILGTLAARQGVDVRVYIEDLAPVSEWHLTGADLVCISTITSTAPAAYRFAAKAREAGVPVVIGGVHATYLPDEALDHADWVIRGEAERAFPKLLEVLAAEGDLDTVPGLSRRVGDEVVHNPTDPTPIVLDDIPAPDFRLLVGHDQKRFRRGVIPVMTSRGCPHSCQFCSVTPMFGRRMRHASPEHVADELERRRGQGKRVFFYDDNFCASPGRTKALLEHLLSKDVFLPAWQCQVSVRAARDEELLALMARAGCETVFVGFESINPEALAIYHKRQAEDDIRKAVTAFHGHGIRVHGMFITGSDAEDVPGIRATAEFVKDQDIDSVQFLVLTPFPGTPMLDELESEGRLLTKDWSLYDTHHAVFQPAKMSPYELMVESSQGMATVYAGWRSASFLARGDKHRFIISLYAASQVRRWRRENKQLLQTYKRRYQPELSFGAKLKQIPGISQLLN